MANHRSPSSLKQLIPAEWRGSRVLATAESVQRKDITTTHPCSLLNSKHPFPGKDTSMHLIYASWAPNALQSLGISIENEAKVSDQWWQGLAPGEPLAQPWYKTSSYHHHASLLIRELRLWVRSGLCGAQEWWTLRGLKGRGEGAFIACKERTGFQVASTGTEAFAPLWPMDFLAVGLWKQNSFWRLRKGERCSNSSGLQKRTCPIPLPSWPQSLELQIC